MCEEDHCCYRRPRENYALIIVLIISAAILAIGTYMLVYTERFSSDQIDGFISETTGFRGTIHQTNKVGRNYTCLSVQCSQFTPYEGLPPCIVRAEKAQFIPGQQTRYYRYSDQEDGWTMCSTKNPLYSTARVCTLVFGIIFVVLTVIICPAGTGCVECWKDRTDRAERDEQKQRDQRAAEQRRAYQSLRQQESGQASQPNAYQSLEGQNE